MSSSTNIPSVPNINIKPKASQSTLEFYWTTPTSTGINSFVPTDIPGLQLWIDADDASTLTEIETESGVFVSSVQDKALGTTFTSIESGNFLMAQPNSINGNQSLYFNNQFSDNVYLQGSFNFPNVGSAFIVFTAQNQFSSAWRALFGTNSSNTPTFEYVNGQINDIAPGITNNFAGGPSYTVTPGTTYLFYISWSGTVATVGTFGSIPVTGFYPSAVNTTATLLNIGTDTGPCVTMNLGELLIFDSILVDTKRQEMEGYLAWKWGLNSQLPTNHLYYTNNPSFGPSPLQGYVLSSVTSSFPYSLEFPASTNHALVSPVPNQTDLIFGIYAYNLNGNGPSVLFQITEAGLQPGGPTNVVATQQSASTVNVTWQFSTNVGEAVTKWFVINAIPSTASFSTILKSCHSSERARALHGLSPTTTYTIIVNAVNDVGYSFNLSQNTTTVVPI